MTKKLPLLLPALLVLGACTRPPSGDTSTQETQQSPPQLQATDETPAANPDARFVFDVQIGDTLAADGKLAAAVSDYAMSDAIHASITLHGKGTGKLRAELQDATNAPIDSQSADISDASGDVYLLSFAPSNVRKPGAHRVLVLLNDKPVWEKPLTLK